MSFSSYTKSFKMPKLLNGLHYNGNGAIAPELVESQPQIMKNVLKSRRPKSKVSIFLYLLVYIRLEYFFLFYSINLQYD